MKFIFMKGVPGISSRVEKNLMIPSLRDFSVMHILEDCICEESGDLLKLVIYLNRFVMEGLGGRCQINIEMPLKEVKK